MGEIYEFIPRQQRLVQREEIESDSSERDDRLVEWIVIGLSISWRISVALGIVGMLVCVVWAAIVGSTLLFGREFGWVPCLCMCALAALYVHQTNNEQSQRPSRIPAHKPIRLHLVYSRTSDEPPDDFKPAA